MSSSPLLLPIGRDLWAAEGTLVLTRGVRFPVRMAIVRLSSGGLWVHSPIALTEELAASVAELGEVAAIVAPTCFHHLYVAAWAARFPHARLHAAMGLSRKRPDLSFHATLGDEKQESPWARDLHAVALGGVPRSGEVVFLHRPSGSLLVSDLVFNVKAPASLATRLMLRMSGTGQELGASRLWSLLAKDRARFAASVERVLSLDFDRLVMSHGAVVESGARSALASALERFTASPARS